MFKWLVEYIKWRKQVNHCEHEWASILVDIGRNKKYYCKICQVMRPYKKEIDGDNSQY